MIFRKEKRMKVFLKALVVLVLGMFFAHAEAAETLNGAGATFPYPVYSAWAFEYSKVSGMQLNYQSIGSGGGIRQISERTVDFGASDGPMTDDQLKKAPAELFHIPTVMGADVATYNLPGNPKLQFTGEVLADIY